MSNTPTKTAFAPLLYISSGISDIRFYTNAFGAVEIMRWSNDDGSLHAAELSIDGVLFHLHEEKPAEGHLEPNKNKGVTTTIGLFVEDVDAVMQKAVAAGAFVVTAAQDYDFGYRQGEIKDPFGHIWCIQKKI
ncbi:VOC family protein [Parasediminibacterium sp. JCM 36343]|uniref:VOC family protein n=1 Tax=Parasediminibacterium sp. JCM 36343 TaxID=3374279 RepID=UPI003977EBCD